MRPRHGYSRAPEAEVLRAGFPESAEWALDVAGGFPIPLGCCDRLRLGGGVADLMWWPFSWKQAAEYPYPRNDGGWTAISCFPSFARRALIGALGFRPFWLWIGMRNFMGLLINYLRFGSLHRVRGPGAVVAPARAFVSCGG
jgi:hypothetical protein